MKSKRGVAVLAVIGLATWLIPFPKLKRAQMTDTPEDDIPTDPVASPDGFRARVVAIANSQVGQPEQYEYAAGALGMTVEEAIRQHTERYSWCGFFATWVLQKAGAAVRWIAGSGISPPLQRTNTPQPGDIGYIIRPAGQTKDVHHYCIVQYVGAEMITTIDGNSTNGLVAQRTRPISEFDAFFNVESVNPDRLQT
jgi:hypothetical protein